MNSTTLDERKNKLFQGAFKFRWVKVNFSLFSLIWLSSPALKYHLNFFKIIFDLLNSLGARSLLVNHKYSLQPLQSMVALLPLFL